MDKEVLKEIKSAKKDAINNMLYDVGFAKTPKEKEVEKKEQKELLDKIAKAGISTLTFPIIVINKIRHHKTKKEEQYYKEKVVDILSKKEHVLHSNKANLT